MIYFIAYILAILIANIGFSYIPMIVTSIGVFSSMAIFVGSIFVLRDYAQRAIGHNILWGMLIGAVLSWWFADPFVAVASVLAFASSEVTDWLLYTLTKKPFNQRVLISSALSTPIDTAVFLLWIDQMSTGTFILMILSKMVAAIVIWYLGDKRVD